MTAHVVASVQGFLAGAIVGLILGATAVGMVIR